jgi:hypothetical protein
MSHKFIRQNSEKIGLDIPKLYIIKSELEKGYKIPELIKVLPYILNKMIIIFECLESDIEIIKYGDENNEKIYFIKYNDEYEIIL